MASKLDPTNAVVAIDKNAAGEFKGSKLAYKRKDKITTISPALTFRFKKSKLNALNSCSSAAFLNFRKGVSPRLLNSKVKLIIKLIEAKNIPTINCQISEN